MLLQVVLHARLAEELPEDERWTVDDVAGDLVDKMIRRNPHVFAGDRGRHAGRDHRQLGADQAGREGPRLGAGRHRAEPARAGPGRARSWTAPPARGLDVPPPVAGRPGGPGARLGASLLAAVAAAREAGLDAEAALRRAALAYATRSAPPTSTATPPTAPIMKSCRDAPRRRQ